MDQNPLTLLLPLLLWLIGPTVGVWIARRRGLPFLTGTLIGLFGIPGWAVLCVLPSVNAPTGKALGAGRSFSVDEDPRIGG